MNRFKHLGWLLILAMAFSFYGCSEDDKGTNSNSDTDFFSDIAEAGDAYFAGTKNITADALWEDIQNGVDPFIIDVRGAELYDTLGHIEGAVNWAMGDLIDNLGEIPSGAKVVVACKTGQTASQATSILQMLGYDAWNLKWGMCGWTGLVEVNQGYWANLAPGGQALETSANDFTDTFELPEAAPGAATVEEAIAMLTDDYFEAGTKIITAEAIYELLNDGDDMNDPFIVNYFAEANYNAGHIPGAYRIQPGSLGEEELANLPTDQQVVIYCYTGQTSSQLASYLNILGYDAYSMKYGMNSITDDPVILNSTSTGLPIMYHAPATNYPVVTGL